MADLSFLDDFEVGQASYPVERISFAPNLDGRPGQDDLALIQVFLKISKMSYFHFHYFNTPIGYSTNHFRGQREMRENRRTGTQWFSDWYHCGLRGYHGILLK